MTIEILSLSLALLNLYIYLIFRLIPFLHKLCAIAHGKVHSLIGGAKIQPPPHVSPRVSLDRWAQFFLHTQTGRTIVTLSAETGA